MKFPGIRVGLIIGGLIGSFILGHYVYPATVTETWTIPTQRSRADIVNACLRASIEATANDIPGTVFGCQDLTDSERDDLLINVMGPYIKSVVGVD